MTAYRTQKKTILSVTSRRFYVSHVLVDVQIRQVAEKLSSRKSSKTRTCGAVLFHSIWL